jgi:hypothetical protein
MSYRCIDPRTQTAKIFAFLATVFAFLAVVFLIFNFLSPIKEVEKRNSISINLQGDVQKLKEKVKFLEEQIENITVTTNSFSISSDVIYSFLTYYNPNLDKEYAKSFADLAVSLMSDKAMVNYPSVFLIALATMGVESGFQLEARNPDSSARGLGQIIYHYHPWLSEYDISQDDLTSHLEKSMYATYLVLTKYWEDNNFSYRKMLYKYRGRDYDNYYAKIMEYTVFLSAKIIHTSI